MKSFYDTELESLKKKINPFKQLNFADLKNKSGIYAFWWIGDFEIIKNANTKVTLLGKTSNGEAEIFKYDWQIEDYEPPICLYIGKSTDFKERISSHLRRNTGWNDWYMVKNAYTEKRERKGTEYHDMNIIYKIDTLCQFRAGLQHLLKENKTIFDLNSALNNIGLSFIEISESTHKYSVGERFYLEDLAIGIFRPLFNIDSER